MIFTRGGKYEKYIPFCFGILLIVLVLGLLLMFVVQKRGSRPGVYKGEPIIIRSQEEIKASYTQDLHKMLGLLDKDNLSAEEKLAQIEAGFFDIYVPTDLRDDHIAALFEIKKIKATPPLTPPLEGGENGGVFLSNQQLKDRVEPILNNLLKKIGN